MSGDPGGIREKGRVRKSKHLEPNKPKLEMGDTAVPRHSALCCSYRRAAGLDYLLVLIAIQAVLPQDFVYFCRVDPV